MRGIQKVLLIATIGLLSLPSGLGAQTSGAASPPASVGQAPIDRRMPVKFRDQLIPDQDGRVLNHLAYQPDAKMRGLKLIAPLSIYIATASPSGTGKKQDCILQEKAAESLNALLAEADKQFPEDGLLLRAFSCYRSIEYQYGPFCHLSATKGSGRCEQPIIRAFKSAPPGFSEHATGYTVDFVIRPANDTGRTKMSDLKWCDKGDTDPCPQIAVTNIGQWLKNNAIQYGFEMSFPGKIDRANGQRESAQGISFEPWHFRWVGTDDSSDAAKDARALFRKARICYPADKPVDNPPANQNADGVTCPGPNKSLG